MKSRHKYNSFQSICMQCIIVHSNIIIIMNSPTLCAPHANTFMRILFSICSNLFSRNTIEEREEKIESGKSRGLNDKNDEEKEYYVFIALTCISISIHESRRRQYYHHLKSSSMLSVFIFLFFLLLIHFILCICLSSNIERWTHLTRFDDLCFAFWMRRQTEMHRITSSSFYFFNNQMEDYSLKLWYIVEWSMWEKLQWFWNGIHWICCCDLRSHFAYYFIWFFRLVDSFFLFFFFFQTVECIECYIT